MSDSKDLWSGYDPTEPPTEFGATATSGRAETQVQALEPDEGSTGVPDAGPPPLWDEFPSDPGDTEALSAEIPVQASRASTATSLNADVLVTLRNVLGAQQGLPAETCMAAVAQIRSDEHILDLLPESVQRTYNGVFEVLDYELKGQDRVTDFGDMPVARFRTKAVRNELAAIKLASTASLPGSPTAAWAAMVEGVQREKCRRDALALAHGVSAEETAEELLAKFRALNAPTAKRVLITQTPVRSAAEWEQEIGAVMAGRELLRFSSGYFTLDKALSNPDEAIGFAAQGEFHILAAGTGQGKSAHASQLVPAMAQDLSNWGLPEARVILAHTEEEVTTKIRQMRLRRGEAHHHLARNIDICPVGSSRKVLAQSVYLSVVKAFHRSQETGLPIDQFLPYVLAVDYIQSLSEEREQEKDAIAKSAEFLLRGVVAWNPEEMAKFSGVEFRAFTGMTWPEHMEHHRVAVVAYAQLIKQDGAGLYYKPGSRLTPASSFVLEGHDGGDAWELREGDQRIPTQNEVRGSGVMLQNATSLMFLHRSRHEGNNVVRVPGQRPYLPDTRARFLLSKTRNGTNLQYVPMRFDSQPSGFRGQYYDPFGEEIAKSGEWPFHESFRDSGDMLLPVRPKRSPLAGFRY